MSVARSRLLSILLVLAAAGCVGSSIPSRVLTEGKSELVLGGGVEVERSTGHIVLHVGRSGCRRTDVRLFEDRHVGESVDACPFEWKGVQLVAPWGQTFPATGGGVDHADFEIDWSRTGIDALESDHPELLNRAWRFSAPTARATFEWTPDRPARQLMLALIGEATDTQVGVAEGGAAPLVVVTEWHFDGELHNGAANELVLTLANRGEGAAYRVRVATRSNIPALHGLHFSFGRLDPGRGKTRRARLRMPRDNAEPEAVVVLVFEEGTDRGPEQTSVRANVLPALDRAVLALTCRFDGLTGSPPRADAGATVHLGCDVRNDGSATRGVRLHVAFPGQKRPIQLPPFDLEARQSTRVNIAMSVPREAAIDSELTVLVGVVDDVGVRADTSVKLAIASPKICPDGRLTREQFVEKRAALRKKRDAGLISGEDYTHYEDELIGCMQP